MKLVLRHEADTGRVIADSFALLLLIDAVRMAAVPDWRPKKASLDRAGGDNLDQFEALSEAEIDRNVDHISLEIPSHFFSLPVIRPSRKSERNRIEDDTLRIAAPSEDLAGSISQAIRSGLATRMVPIQHAAEMARMGVRTLQRKLRAEGLIYSDLVNRVRFQEAGKLLVEPNMKIAEISHSLGYSDPANFTHAFQRWSGITPSTYRAEALHGIR